MRQVTITWSPVESKSALASVFENEIPANEIVTEEPNKWGFFKLQNEKIIVVGYAELGLSPVAVMLDGCLFVGIDELLVCFDADTLQQKFSYRMPSVFHEFVSLGNRIIVRDEIGFVCVSADGYECWKFLTDGPISSFNIEGKNLHGKTIDEEPFEFSIPP